MSPKQGRSELSIKTENKDGKTIVKMQPAEYSADRLIEKEGSAVGNDERCKLILICSESLPPVRKS